MSGRARRPQGRWVWFTVLLVACVLAGMQSRPDRLGSASVPAEVVGAVGAPVESFLTAARGGLAGAWRFVTHLSELEQENARLRRQLALSQAQAEQSAEWRQEVARLRALLDVREPVALPAVAARTIGHGPSPWFRTLTITAGERDGVAPGAPVLAPGGLVGQVYQTGYATSKVLCLTDRLGRVGARLQPDRARQVLGVSRGDGSQLCRLTYPNAAADARPADAVVTSGHEHGSQFPAGLLIGHVVSLERRPDESSLVCWIRPAVDPDQVEDVLVLVRGAAVARAPEAAP